MRWWGGYQRVRTENQLNDMYRNEQRKVRCYRGGRDLLIETDLPVIDGRSPLNARRTDCRYLRCLVVDRPRHAQPAGSQYGCHVVGGCGILTLIIGYNATISNNPFFPRKLGIMAAANGLL